MILTAVMTSVFGVLQTLISTTVGQRVMHDLRTAVYTQLQRMPLAFFTRTRTGEVQSRIANDIGGMQATVTSTATSLVSNLTAVIATVVAMLALDWRLTVVSLLLLPVFVAISRRVGRERKKITTQRQKQMAAMAATVTESLSVSGILLGRTMGRSDSSPRASPRSPSAWSTWKCAPTWPAAGGCPRSASSWPPCPPSSTGRPDSPSRPGPPPSPSARSSPS